MEKLPEPQAPSLRPLSVNNPTASTVLEDGVLYVLARSATVVNDTFLGRAVFRSPEWSESLTLAPLKNFLERNPCTFSVSDPVFTVRDLWRLVPLGALPSLCAGKRLRGLIYRRTACRIPVASHALLAAFFFCLLCHHKMRTRLARTDLCR